RARRARLCARARGQRSAPNGRRLRSSPDRRAAGSGRRRDRGRPDAVSDGVLDLDELPLDVELIADSFGERLDAEALGGVVAGRNQMDAELACGVQARLFGLAGDEAVVALV